MQKLSPPLTPMATKKISQSRQTQSLSIPLKQRKESGKKLLEQLYAIIVFQTFLNHTYNTVYFQKVS